MRLAVHAPLRSSAVLTAVLRCDDASVVADAWAFAFLTHSLHAPVLADGGAFAFPTLVLLAPVLADGGAFAFLTHSLHAPVLADGMFPNHLPAPEHKPSTEPSLFVFLLPPTGWYKRQNTKEPHSQKTRDIKSRDLMI
jgi:hypothetical protein